VEALKPPFYEVQGVQTLTRAGDQVLITDPRYPLVESIMTALDRLPVRVRARPEHGFRITLVRRRSTYIFAILPF
jgi:aspartate/methionine/tyrosine aminotransferase